MKLLLLTLFVSTLAFASNISHYGVAGSGQVFPPSTDLSMASHKLTNLADPAAAHDAATDAWVTANFMANSSLNSDLITEGSTNLYFTATRAKAAVSATAPVVDTSGVISMAKATASVDGYLGHSDFAAFNGKEPAVTAGTSSQYYRGDKTWQTLSTTAVAEGTNLYYTDARAQSAVMALPLNTASNLVALDAGGNLPQGAGLAPWLVGIVSTTDATVTTLYTQALTNAYAYTCKALVTAFRTDAQDTGHWEVVGSAYRNGGGCVLEDSTRNYEKRSDVSFQADWSCSGNNLLLRVTGAAAKSIRWTTNVACQRG